MTLALAIFCLGLSVLFAWGATRPDTWTYHRSRLIAASGICVALAILCGYFHWKDVQAPDELAKHIPVYPEISGVTWVPPVSEELYWLIDTPDEPEAVVAFYEGVATSEGWELRQDGGGAMTFLHMQRGRKKVFLSITREPDGSKLAYQVSEGE